MLSCIQIYQLIAEIVLLIAVLVFLVAAVYGLKVNLSTLRTVKKLEERVTALEEGSESDVTN